MNGKAWYGEGEVMGVHTNDCVFKLSRHLESEVFARLECVDHAPAIVLVVIVDLCQQEGGKISVWEQLSFIQFLAGSGC